MANAESVKTISGQSETLSCPDEITARILSHRRYVKQLVRRFLPNNKGYDLDDLISAGMIGLIESARRFDPTRGVKFETFVRSSIPGRVIREFKRNPDQPEVSLDAPMHSEEDSRTWYEALRNPMVLSEAMLHDAIDQRKALEAIKEIVLGMSERDQQIFHLYFIEEQTTYTISPIVGLTHQRVCQLTEKIRKEIIKKLNKELRSLFTN